MSKSINHPVLAVFVLLLLITGIASAQTTEFTYQGRLVDGSLPANTPHDFEFRLFSVNAGGAALATNQRPGVSVSNGVFTVRLDFSGNFGGSDRWLEIAVKPAGSPNPFTVLNPRQPLTSTPYSIRSLNSATADDATNATNAATATNALQLGGVAASQYVLTGDARLSDTRAPTAGSPNYVQNTAASQASSNFNISGNGTAGGTLSSNIVNATTQYNIGGSRALSVTGSNNVFAGVDAGASNTSGSNNSFFGRAAGRDNTIGGENSFFGRAAGNNNTTGGENSFFGDTAGNSNTIGSNNTIIGDDADVGFGNLSFATAIGALAIVSSSNTIALGRANGSDRVLVYGLLDLTVLGSAGATALCRNASGHVASCSSSLRYKTDVNSFFGGLDVVRRLRPITFNWKDGGMSDLGFAAEEVEKIEPLLTTYNDKGEIEGVKYAQITTVLVNAVNEQQTQIDEQRKQIDALKKLICSQNPQAEVCKEEQK